MPPRSAASVVGPHSPSDWRSPSLWGPAPDRSTAILTLAADSRSVGTGSLLLLVYSLGLALPFIASALLLDRFGGALKWLTRHTRTVTRIAGGVLVLLGLAMMTGLIDRVGVWLRALPIIGSIG